MADRKLAYAAAAGITITLNSLADLAARESTVVSNTTNKYLDALVTASLTPAVAPGSPLELYVYASVDGGTDYTDSATGADAAFTASKLRNARHLGSVRFEASGTALVRAGPFSVAELFGGVLPEKWGIIALNETGQALASSSNSAEYQGVYETVA
jgi:hypothetical protein